MVFIKYRKIIGSLFIAAGITLVLPGPTDPFTNFPLAAYISKNMGISPVQSILATYTIIPVLIIWAGAIIHPSLHPSKVIHLTQSKVSSHISPFISRLKNDRELQLVTILVLLIMYKIYLFYTSGASNIFD